jgi:hypothetical protein
MWAQSTWPNYPNNTSISVSSAGNVGIGTSIPVAALDVNGTVKHGGRVLSNEPNALLPAAIGATAADHLAIHVIGPSGLAQPVLIAAQDAEGRDHMLVVPYDTPLKLLIHSSTFILKDAGGKDLAETATTSFTASQAGPPPSFLFNVDRPKP